MKIPLLDLLHICMCEYQEKVAIFPYSCLLDYLLHYACWLLLAYIHMHTYMYTYIRTEKVNKRDDVRTQLLSKITLSLRRSCFFGCCYTVLHQFSSKSIIFSKIKNGLPVKILCVPVGNYQHRKYCDEQSVFVAG